MKPSFASPYLSIVTNPSCVIFGIVIGTAILIISPLLALITYPVYLLASIISYRMPNYGKFIGYFDAWMEEDFVNAIPRNTVVTTLTINGDISLDEFRSIFKKNVLEARCRLNPEKIRYPELKQYLVTFMGYRIWKNDDKFKIENHITEKNFESEGQDLNCDIILSNVHQKILNLKYPEKRSPWDITVVRNIKLGENDKMPQTLVVCRTHHVLADGKSLIKLFVQCLGGKEVKAATPQVIRKSWLDRITFYPLYLIYFHLHFVHLYWALALCHFHPWKINYYWKDREVKSVLAFSPKLSMSDIKMVAKSNGVAVSAVIMSIITEGIRKSGEELRKADVSIGYILPKPNHPEVLTNHTYLGFLRLPTKEDSIHKRLKKCHDYFTTIKTNQQDRYLDFLTLTAGCQIFPLTRLAVNYFSPTGITNIAGDEEGFFVGNKEVVDFRMTVGTMVGVAGVVFCAFSYKNEISIAVNAKESILTRKEVEKLASDISQELDNLVSLCKVYY